MGTEATRATTRGGLDGVIVADTRLSDVDGEKGTLVIGGYDAEWLAEHATYEAAVSLLDGALDAPDRAPLDAQAARLVAEELGAARARAFEALAGLGDALDAADGMDALRASVAHLPSSAGDRALVGAMPVFAAAWQRRRLGLTPIAPNAGASHAADYLHMITGTEPEAARVRALDAYLVTVIDHGMNASTFTARVITSTGSDVVSAVVGAIGALKGPLHGGAPGPVLDMLDAVGSPDRARAWLEATLASGERIMGMGHRIYRTRDPRAEILEVALRRFSESRADDGRLSLARAVERSAEELLEERHPERPLKANVEFYTAVLLEAVGLPREAFTQTFAVGRVGGWVAHAKEQRKLGRLLRPASRYVGPRHGGEIRH